MPLLLRPILLWYRRFFLLPLLGLPSIVGIPTACGLLFRRNRTFLVRGRLARPSFLLLGCPNRRLLLGCLGSYCLLGCYSILLGCYCFLGCPILRYCFVIGLCSLLFLGFVPLFASFRLLLLLLLSSSFCSFCAGSLLPRKLIFRFSYRRLLPLLLRIAPR